MRSCAICAAEPCAGSCTRIPWAARDGTTASITILPATASLISSRIASWFENGTAITTMSPALRRAEIVVAAHRGRAVPGHDVPRRCLGLLARARSEHHRIAGRSPAHRKAHPERAGAADDRQHGSVFVGRYSSSVIAIVGGCRPPQSNDIAVSGTISTPAASRPVAHGARELDRGRFIAMNAQRIDRFVQSAFRCAR